jgi:hypothetical protein
MKSTWMWMSILAVAACGGGNKPAAQPKDPEPMANETESKPAPEPEPEAAPPPPPPKKWHAAAELTPVKGSRIKPATVTFEQEEGGETSVSNTGWFDGLKAGKYHLVVHASADCGNNATKAGRVMVGSDMPFTNAKGATSLEVDKTAALALDGDSTIIGHSLVLHDDKKGKIGKPLACGPIAVVNE